MGAELVKRMFDGYEDEAKVEFQGELCGPIPTRGRREFTPSFHEQKLLRMVREAVMVCNGPPNEVHRWAPGEDLLGGRLKPVASVGRLELEEEGETCLPEEDDDDDDDDDDDYDDDYTSSGRSAESEED